MLYSYQSKTKRNNTMAEALATISLSTSELEDPEFVNTELDRIYAELGKKPDEKSMALTGLVNAIRTRDGSHLGDEIIDTILESATSDDEKSEGFTMRQKVLGSLTAETSPIHPEVPITTLEVQIDVDTLDVRNIFRKTVLPDEKESSVEAKRSMQNRMPSGPKQNDASLGGVHRIDPSKRR